MKCISICSTYEKLFKNKSCIGCMAYYIFLKSLRSLEEFRKNPHVKIPPKFPSTNLQSLGKFKNPIFNSEILFLDFGPADLRPTRPLSPASPLAMPFPTGRRAQPAHLARASVASSREIRFPFQIMPSRAGRLLPLSPPRGPHLSTSSSPPRRPTPVRNFPAPLPRASDAPELLQPSLVTLPP
jgi:hypothetical protein